MAGVKGMRTGGSEQKAGGAPRPAGDVSQASAWATTARGTGWRP